MALAGRVAVKEVKSMVKEVKSMAELDSIVGNGAPGVLQFWASRCEVSKHMDQVFAHLSGDFPLVRFLRVELEEQSEISGAYSVSSGPYFVFFKDGKALDTLEGADPSSLTNKIAKVAGSIKPGEPQLYGKGNLLGGSDHAISIYETGQPSQVFKDHGIETIDAETGKTEPNVGMGGISNSSGLSAATSDRLRGLVNSSPVMLFMNGKPDDPQCDFSRMVVDILREEKVEFESFDVLTDDGVRQGLKVYSNWSSYPQLYIEGQLIGGADIVQEMQVCGELKVLGEKEIPFGVTMENRLNQLLNTSPVMLFMEGTPDAPKCGFSSKVVNALQEEGVEFGWFDILNDEEVREGLKAYSNWPTFPQLCYEGELIGGCDIVLELRNCGELKNTLSG